MPNQPRPDNPVRAIRVDDALWARVRARADDDGVTGSAVVRDALDAYLNPGRGSR